MIRLTTNRSRLASANQRANFRRSLQIASLVLSAKSWPSRYSPTSDGSSGPTNSPSGGYGQYGSKGGYTGGVTFNPGRSLVSLGLGAILLLAS